jgi:tRNA(fMet)-specific endonuclease VapC
MKYLLDSSVCVEHLRRGPKSPLTAKLLQLPVREVAICSVVRAEFVFGVLRSKNPHVDLRRVPGLLVEDWSNP